MISGQLRNGTSKEEVKQTDGEGSENDLHSRDAWGPQPTAGWQSTMTARIFFYLEPEGTRCFHK